MSWGGGERGWVGTREKAAPHGLRQVPGLALVPDPGLPGAFMGFAARLCATVPGSLGGTSEPV